MKNLTEIIDILTNSFSVSEYKENDKLCGYELNTYTDGGVNQIIFLDFRDSGDPLNPSDLIAKFSERIKDIDIDDEIELNRQDKLYKANFTFRESLVDFESWKRDLEKIAKSIKK